MVACGAELAGSLVEDWAGGTLIESVCVLLVRRAKNEFEQHREVFFYHVGSNIYILTPVTNTLIPLRSTNVAGVGVSKRLGLT